MKQIIKLTLALTLLFCLYAFFAGVVDESFRVGLYYAMLGFGSLIFPMLIFVILYHLLFRNRFNYANLWLSFLAKSIALILIAFVGLFVWAILEFIVTAGFNLDFYWILKDYRNEYLNYMLPVTILSLLIPIGHYFFRPDVRNTGV